MLKLYAFSQALVNPLCKREEGQTMAEYGLVLAVITLTVIAAITLLAGNVSNALNAVAGVLPYVGQVKLECSTPDRVEHSSRFPSRSSRLTLRLVPSVA